MSVTVAAVAPVEIRPDLGRVIAAIERAKQQLGRKLVILTHHYQRPEIVRLGHLRGDSFRLSEAASREIDAKYIVFCGVHFMAQSAAMLCREDQIVLHPNLRAGCPMADMADLGDVERAWNELTEVLGRPADDCVVPVAYMNTAADIKGFVGAHDGAVCTSSNADRVLAWGWARQEKLLFLPDEHLGRNTATAMGVPPDAQLVWDYTKPLGGHDPDAIRRAKILLWQGHCHVHTWFTPEMVATIRANHPHAAMIVHPECDHSVVRLADATGSTEKIVRTVEQAPAGATVIIGTEVNLITRLAHERPDVNVIGLSRSLCPNMYRINLHNLRDTLDALVAVEQHNAAIPDDHVVRVTERVRNNARIALDHMLALRGSN